MGKLKGGWRTLTPWALFLLWMVVVVGGLVSNIASGENPTDFRSYRPAADQISQGESPYGTLAESQANWLEMNQSVEAQFDSASSFQISSEPVPGPYVYPPTLALALEQLNIGPISFVLILVLSTVGFAWLWLRETQAKSTWWLLLIIFSLDVVIFIGFSNIEIFLLFISLLAAWLIWYRYALIAGFLIAIAVLIKPFFALFFAGYCLMMIAATSTKKRPDRIRLTTISALSAIGLIILEIFRWPDWLKFNAGTNLARVSLRPKTREFAAPSRR